LSARRGKIRDLAISLSRNYGHQAALSAALDYVTADAPVVMDGICRQIPEAIRNFWKSTRKDMTSSMPARRRKEPLLLRICYFTFLQADAKRPTCDCLDSGISV